MTKILLIIFLISSSFSVFSACANKINPSKVMLFIDANYGDMEIAAAEKSACQRGERLEVVPKNWSQYSGYQKTIEMTYNTLASCQKKDINADCDKQREVYNAANSKFRDFTAKQKSVKDQVKERMDELSKEKVKLTNLTLSGHDGGGFFGGQKGNISRGEISEIMSDHPEINDVQSLLLLGCYTGVQNEVSAWKGIFSKVKIIGGYDGSAPASSRIQGHNYITNILNKEKALLSLKNKGSVDQDVKRLIGNLGDLNSAMYIDLACKEDDEFYYASKLDRTFSKLNLSDCQKSMIEMERLKPLYNKFYSGEIEPPTMTSSGVTRDIYDKVRTHEHCINLNVSSFGGSGSEMDSNGSFNLLFWHGVKKNFGHFYDKEMKEVEEILKNLNQNEMIKVILSHLGEIEINKNLISDQLKELVTNPESYMTKAEAEVDDLIKKSDEAEQDPAYRAVMQKMNSLGYAASPEDILLMNKVNKLISDVFVKQNELLTLKKSQNQYIDMKKMNLSYLNETISEQKRQISNIQSNPDLLKNLWIPTKENMEKKTRKEVMENIHAVNGLLITGGLDSKKQQALQFVNAATTSHLQYLRNPFSWHEFTRETETPPFAPKLSSYLNGGMYGMMSPAINGGAQLNEDDRPAH